MRWWVLAALPERCGRCGTAIPVGAPLLRISLAEVRKTKTRCAKCAGEPTPAHVPPSQPVEPLTVLRRLGYLPLDEEREPGSDG